VGGQLLLSEGGQLLARAEADIRQRVYRGHVDSAKTTNSIRKPALASGLVEEIRLWREVSLDTSADTWVFSSETGKTPLGRDNVWRRRIGPKLEAVGLGWVDFHVMRRTHATLMNELHDGPKLVADQLRHTVDVNQNVYTRAPIARRKEAVDALESTLPVM
jgi:integrase